MKQRTKNKKQKTGFFLFSLLVFCSLFSVPRVHAAGLDLSVSPAIFQIELTPPAEVNVDQNLTLENNSTDPVELSVQFKPFVPDGSDTGTVRYLKEGEKMTGSDPKIFDKVQLVENGKAVERVSLGPKQKRKFDLIVSVPKDEPPSDYYFSIVFVSQSPSSPQTPQSSSTIAAGGIAVNVLLSIGPKTKTTGQIETFDAPFFFDSGPVPFTVKIKNTSSHFIYPKGQILIKNMFGQTIGKVDLLPVNILGDSVRAMPSKEDFVFAAQAEQESNEQKTENKKALQTLKKLGTFTSPVGIWPETFLLGPYSATLSVALSDEGPLLTKTIHFVGLPVYLLAGVIVAVLLVLLVRSRLRKQTR